MKTLYTDETKAIETCTEQGFRVIQIRISINSFLIENFPKDELVNLNFRSSSKTSNNAVGSLPENARNPVVIFQNSEIHVSSKNSRVSYLSVNKRRRTTGRGKG